jgi:hypothetical protein
MISVVNIEECLELKKELSNMAYKFNIRTITTPLLIGVLKEEMRFPASFMLRLALEIDARRPSSHIKTTSMNSITPLRVEKESHQ